jgi:hypothetical protein
VEEMRWGMGRAKGGWRMGRGEAMPLETDMDVEKDCISLSFPTPRAV